MASEYWLYLNWHAGLHKAVRHRGVYRSCRPRQGQSIREPRRPPAAGTAPT